MADDEQPDWALLEVPDDISELAEDIAAYHRELRAQERQRRWPWLPGGPSWQRLGLPAAIVGAALILSVVVALLLTVLAPSLPTAPATALPPVSTSASGPTGQVGGPLPDAVLSDASNHLLPASQVPIQLGHATVVFVLVPPSCGCTDTVAAIAKQAQSTDVPAAVVVDAASDADTAALPSELHVGDVSVFYDPKGVLAQTFKASGVTVLLDHRGVVSYDKRNSTGVDPAMSGPLADASLVGG